MMNFNQQHFVDVLANMGFEVEDLSTETVDAHNATVQTEKGTFEITVRNDWVVFHKPNGTTKDYWGSTAQILAYVRQTLKANGGIVEPEPTPEPEVEETPQAETETPEPEVEEVPQADVEGLTYVGTTANGEDLFEEAEPEAPKTVRSEALSETTTARPVDDMTLDWWENGETHTSPAWRGDNGKYFVMVNGTLYSVRQLVTMSGDLRLVLGGAWEEVTVEVDEETVRRAVDYVVRTYPKKLERDLDAVNEGWDAISHPDDGYVYQWALKVLEAGMSDGQALPDEALDWLADATYSVLCPTTDEGQEDPSYEVVVCDGREDVCETTVCESFDDLAGAQARFDELKAGFDFGEHDELWLFEVGADGTSASVDGWAPTDRQYIG